MKKLKLQIQMSVDGFVARKNGDLDWLIMNWDNELKKYVIELTDSVDTILLGRKMTPGFINYWSGIVTKPEHDSHTYAMKMIDKPKYVFSKTLNKSEWKNTTVVNGNLNDEVNKIKQLEGMDIIVYGGADFVSSLINAELIDEYHLFINPAAIGKGMRIFDELDKTLKLYMAECRHFQCGITLLKYIPKK